MKPGILYYDNEKDIYYLLIGNIILKGNIRNVVNRNETFKTAPCKYGNSCALDSCTYYHNYPGEERNIKSNMFTKLIHSKSNLKKSVKNFQSKSEMDRNKYFEMHSDFVMHNILILLSLQDKSILDNLG